MFEKTSLFCRELTEMEKVISLRLMRFNRAILRDCFSFMLFFKVNSCTEREVAQKLRV
jgi:hypothetical protein